MIDHKAQINLIKTIDELPKTPEDSRLRFTQGIKSHDAARGVCSKERVGMAWLFAKRERLYWFERKAVSNAERG